MFGRKKKKKNFLERITGAVHLDDEDFDEHDVDIDQYENSNELQEDQNPYETIEEELDGELAVDVINTDDAIIIKAMIAGVRPNDIDVDLSRDMVTIKASREEETEVQEENYFQKELYWGSFSRNILLPEEIDVDMAEAKEKNGLLVLTLPKVDKNRKTKLQVKG
jgi:HSP20 family protein